MKYRLLGNSGLRVSETALGTMTLGEDWGWGTPKDESQRVYKTYRNAGGNFIDTANVYTNGTSEKFLGEFIKSDRGSVVLATKYSNALGAADPNAAGNHRKSMIQALEAAAQLHKRPSINPSRIDRFVPGLGWTRDGDLSGFRARLRGRGHRKEAGDIHDSGRQQGNRR